MRGVVPMRWVWKSLYVVKLYYVFSSRHNRYLIVIWCIHFMSFETMIVCFVRRYGSWTKCLWLAPLILAVLVMRGWLLYGNFKCLYEWVVFSAISYVGDSGKSIVTMGEVYEWYDTWGGYLWGHIRTHRMFDLNLTMHVCDVLGCKISCVLCWVECLLSLV